MKIYNISIFKIPKIICWIIFVIHFIFLIGFHGHLNYNKSPYDIILDIVDLIILQSITLFIVLSEIHNSYVFYKYAFFFSILNLLAILLSIPNYFSCLCKVSIFKCNLDCKQKYLLSILILFLKIIEICPLFIIINLSSKIKKNPGNIESVLIYLINSENILVDC